MPQSISTKRLHLRPLKASDFEFIRGMHVNVEVMKYIGTGVPRTLEQTEAAIERYTQLEKTNPNLGLWVVTLKETDQKIGTFLLREPATVEKTDGLEVGFSYMPEYWGRGYASEALKGVMEYVKRVFPRTRLIGQTDPGNLGSQGALKKAGFVEVSGQSQYLDPSTGLIHPTTFLVWEELL